MKYDFIALTISCLLVLAYYLYLARRTRRLPESSVHALNARMREHWTLMIMSNDKKDILAIQTLRNSVIAANFMASTAILLILGSLNISEKMGQYLLSWHTQQFGEHFSTELWQLKLSLLVLVFAIAFFYFSMAIRFFNHVGYMINLADAESIDQILYNQTCAYLNRAGRYYTLGMRNFFFSLPVIAWFFGASMLVLATLALIIALAILDKVPS